MERDEVGAEGVEGVTVKVTLSGTGVTVSLVGKELAENVTVAVHPEEHEDGAEVELPVMVTFAEFPCPSEMPESDEIESQLLALEGLMV